MSGTQGPAVHGGEDVNWVLFDYGGVLCEPQPEADPARLALASGGPAADLRRPTGGTGLTITGPRWTSPPTGSGLQRIWAIPTPTRRSPG